MYNSRPAFVIYIAVKRNNDAAKSPPAGVNALMYARA